MIPIRNVIDPDANLVLGMVVDESLGDKAKVTVIATVFDAARHGGNDPMPGNKALDLDTILSRSFDKPAFLRRRRPPTRGGVNDTSSSNALEEELDIPTFLRVRKREA